MVIFSEYNIQRLYIKFKDNTVSEELIHYINHLTEKLINPFDICVYNLNDDGLIKNIHHPVIKTNNITCFRYNNLFDERYIDFLNKTNQDSSSFNEDILSNRVYSNIMLPGVEEVLKTLNHTNTMWFNCPAIYHTLYLDNYGIVYDCCDYNKKIGHISEQYEQLLSKINILHSQHLKGCPGCPAATLCRGGCPKRNNVDTCRNRKIYYIKSINVVEEVGKLTTPIKL